MGSRFSVGFGDLSGSSGVFGGLGFRGLGFRGLGFRSLGFSSYSRAVGWNVTCLAVSGPLL